MEAQTNDDKVVELKPAKRSYRIEPGAVYDICAGERVRITGLTAQQCKSYGLMERDEGVFHTPALPLASPFIRFAVARGGRPMTIEITRIRGACLEIVTASTGAHPPRPLDMGSAKDHVQPAFRIG